MTIFANNMVIHIKKKINKKFSYDLVMS